MSRGQTHLAEQAEQLTQGGKEIIVIFGTHRWTVQEARHSPDHGVLICTIKDGYRLMVDVEALSAVGLSA